ncbi:hypothetical protein FGLOB1_9494 [Fusarium globosum]|uniref:Uncharacterized protein n=1 Tax=Fusarium globosum TaxID=78864 RepID=A0A8H5XZA8_9HYPO|nr:hypothetical protein FGLOB1_9494 [Fusarium globosum]
MSGSQYLTHGVSQAPVFACPFYNTDPVKFHECSHLRLSRFSDVSWHIKRCHTLQEVRLCTAQGAKAAIKTGKEKGTCTDPKDIMIYDPICRLVFRGVDAEKELQRHLDDNICQPKTIEEMGMLLPKELERGLGEGSSATMSSEAKWYAIWSRCFPPLTTTRFKNVPASPYFQITVAREATETLIRQALDKLPITPEHHRSTVNEIVNGIYPVQFEADAEVKTIVKDQQEKRTRVLQEAEFEEFYGSTFDSSEVTSSDFPSAVPTYHQLQQQTLEQSNNGMMDLPSLLPGELQPLQLSYPTMPSHYTHMEPQAPPQMPGSAYEQCLELDDFDPSIGYTCDFSDAY